VTIERVQQHFNDSIQTKIASAQCLAEPIVTATHAIVRALLAGHKLLVCGNGGSAADAQHFSAELLNRFETERPGLPAISLTTDSSTLTSIANDYDFVQVYAKQVKALGQAGDILIAISTSGNSANIINAVQSAQTQQMQTIILSGNNGGDLTDILTEKDIEICVPAKNTARIQETHILILHCICDLIDKQLFG